MSILGIEVTVIAVAYIILSASLQRKMVNMKRVYEVQEIIKIKSKELTELIKNNADNAALTAKQKEVTSLLSESMRSQIKPIFVILPIFLILYYLIFPAIFPSDLTVMFFSMKLDYRAYFIVVAFILGLVLSIGMMIYDRAKIKKNTQNAQNTGTAL